MTTQQARSSPEPLVSVVTPDNGERYLGECIESVLAQTYPRWEYVIVDNESVDRSGELAAGYARRDARIRLIRAHEHLPVYASSNRAARQIDPGSRWVKMLCADDWLFPECLERMVDAANAAPSITLVGAYRLDDDQVNLDGLPVSFSAMHGRRVGRACMLGLLPYLWGSPTSTIVRADLVRSFERFYHED